MKMLKVLRIFTVLALFSAGPAAADLRSLLNECTALEHDLGLLDGLVHSFRAVRISKPSDFSLLAGKDESMKTWNAITSYQDAIFLARGMISKTINSLNDFRDPEIRNNVQLSLKPLLNFSEADGHHNSDFWNHCRDTTMDIIRNAADILDGIRMSAIRKMEASGSRLVNFVEAVRAQNPNMFSAEEQTAIQNAEAAYQRLASLKQAIQAEEQKLTASRQEWRAEEAQHTTRLRQAVNEQEQRLAICRERLGASTAECIAVETQLGQRRIELQGIFHATLEQEMAQFTNQQLVQFAHQDTKQFSGLEHLPQAVHGRFQEAVSHVFDSTVQLIAPQRPNGSFLTFIVDAKRHKKHHLLDHADNPHIEFEVTLKGDAMQGPVMVTTFEDKYEHALDALRKYLAATLPGIIQGAASYYNCKMSAIANAGNQARLRCEQLQAPAMSQPYQPGFQAPYYAPVTQAVSAAFTSVAPMVTNPYGGNNNNGPATNPYQ
jgi:hypothetical protein